MITKQDRENPDFTRGFAAGRSYEESKNIGYNAIKNRLFDIYYDLANYKYPLDELAMDKLKLLFEDVLDKRLPKYAWDE